MLVIPSPLFVVRRFGLKLAAMASQVAVAVVATGLTTSLFTGPKPTPAPQAESQPANASSKLTLRIPNAAEAAPVLALYPGDAAAMASLAAFTPTRGFRAAPTAVAGTTESAPRLRIASVLPPRRPSQARLDALAAPAPLASAAQTVAQQPSTATRGTIRIAGLSIPAPSLDIVSYIPRSGEFVRDLSRKTLSAVGNLTHVAIR